MIEWLTENAIERLAKTFKVLSDPTRIKIINALKTHFFCSKHSFSYHHFEQSLNAYYAILYA